MLGTIPEPTRMSQRRKKHMARPGLEPRTSRKPCEHSDHWATEPHGRPVSGGNCHRLIVWLGSSVASLLALYVRDPGFESPVGRQNVTGEEKAHDPTGTRTQDLSHTVRALWPLSYRATRSTCDNFPLQPSRWQSNHSYIPQVLILIFFTTRYFCLPVERDSKCGRGM